MRIYFEKEIATMLIRRISIGKICNFTINIGIIVIKSKETRAVIYTYRYSSGQFNP